MDHKIGKKDLLIILRLMMMSSISNHVTFLECDNSHMTLKNIRAL